MILAHLFSLFPASGTIVPLPLLRLFSAHELELLVCGRRDIDVDYLKVLIVPMSFSRFQ